MIRFNEIYWPDVWKVVAIVGIILVMLLIIYASVKGLLFVIMRWIGV